MKSERETERRCHSDSKQISRFLLFLFLKIQGREAFLLAQSVKFCLKMGKERKRRVTF